MFRGMEKFLNTAVAAAASGGATIAPRTTAAARGNPRKTGSDPSHDARGKYHGENRECDQWSQETPCRSRRKVVRSIHECWGNEKREIS